MGGQWAPPGVTRWWAVGQYVLDRHRTMGCGCDVAHQHAARCPAHAAGANQPRAALPLQACAATHSAATLSNLTSGSAGAPQRPAAAAAWLARGTLTATQAAQGSLPMTSGGRQLLLPRTPAAAPPAPPRWLAWRAGWATGPPRCSGSAACWPSCGSSSVSSSKDRSRSNRRGRRSSSREGSWRPWAVTAAAAVPPPLAAVAAAAAAAARLRRRQLWHLAPATCQGPHRPGRAPGFPLPPRRSPPLPPSFQTSPSPAAPAAAAAPAKP